MMKGATLSLKLGTSVPVLWGHTAVQITLMLGQTKQYQKKKQAFHFWAVISHKGF